MLKIYIYTSKCILQSNAHTKNVLRNSEKGKRSKRKAPSPKPGENGTNRKRTIATRNHKCEAWVSFLIPGIKIQNSKIQKFKNSKTQKFKN